MTQEILNNFAKLKKKTQEIKSGYTVKIHQKIKEAEKERIQIFQGLVIKVNAGYGSSASITVRKVVDGIGVEKIFPLASPIISKIEIIKKAKVRRSKLYYMRKLSGKSARLREKYVKRGELDEKELEEIAKKEIIEQEQEKAMIPEAKEEIKNPEPTTKEEKKEETK
jgi:large subunit ribosomal protein L19